MIRESFLLDMMPGVSGQNVSAGAACQPEKVSDADLKLMRAFSRVIGMDLPDPSRVKYTDPICRDVMGRKFFG